jgi:YVTN family beta-propeller protein
MLVSWLSVMNMAIAFTGVHLDQTPQATLKLYVTNSAGDNIHVIDLGALKVIGQIQTGDRPHGAAASADGRHLFTSVEGTKTLLVIDTATDKVVKSIPLTGLPNQCAVTPDGRFAGVPIRDGDSVNLVDMAQGKVVKNLPVKVPHNCYNAPAKRSHLCDLDGRQRGEADRLDHPELSRHDTGRRGAASARGQPR